MTVKFKFKKVKINKLISCKVIINVIYTRRTKIISYSARITKNYNITRIKGVLAQGVLIISGIAQEVHLN